MSHIAVIYYEESDIPEGLTLREWRRRQDGDARSSRRLWRAAGYVRRVVGPHSASPRVVGESKG